MHCVVEVTDLEMEIAVYFQKVQKLCISVFFFVVGQLCEKLLEMRKAAYQEFICMEKTYENVDRE